MESRNINNVKLGVFVLAGLGFLILLLYLMGKNNNLFGDTYVLKARFDNVQGLVPGSNVRFSGIHAGTVKKIKILNDTTIEVTMIMESKMQTIIRKNALASIGSDGLVGNRLVNIVPQSQPSALALEGDVIASKKTLSTDEMLQTLNRTNKDVAAIAEALKTTVRRINTSSALWKLLNEDAVPHSIVVSVANLQAATGKALHMAKGLDAIVTNVQDGKGTVGMLLKDSSLANSIYTAVAKLQVVGDEADSLAIEINELVAGLQKDVNTGKGPVNALLHDSILVQKLSTSLDNIQKGTDGFNQNMEALKHNFLLRGYFKKLEKKQRNQ